jgi:tRNA (guanine-N7-)-methyltransferase
MEDVDTRFLELRSVLQKRSSDGDPSLQKDLSEYRALRREQALKKAAESHVKPKIGGCQFFIVRKQRYCSNMSSVANSDGLCIHHQHVQNPESRESIDVEESMPEANEQPEVQEQNPKHGAGKRKRNMSRCPKHMLNPFKCPLAVSSPNWDEIYSDTNRPLLLDIGCAKGRWIEQLASETSVRLELDGRQFNYCGVELYAPLVEMANANILSSRREGCHTNRNLHYISANINVSLASLKFPSLHTVCIQFPDPWIKKRKRRVVTPSFVAALSAILPKGGQVADSNHLHGMESFFLNLKRQVIVADHKIIVGFLKATLFFLRLRSALFDV